MPIFVSACLQDGSGIALRFLEHGPGVSKKLVSHGGLPCFEAVYELAIRTAADNPNFAFKFFEKSPALITRIACDELAEFVHLPWTWFEKAGPSPDSLLKNSADLLGWMGLPGLKTIAEIGLKSPGKTLLVPSVYWK